MGKQKHNPRDKSVYAKCMRAKGAFTLAAGGTFRQSTTKSVVQFPLPLPSPHSPSSFQLPYPLPP